MSSDVEDRKRKPRNWEALKALESVSPPSPSPSFGSDFITTLSSVGEIPIIIDSGLMRSNSSDIFVTFPSRQNLQSTSSAATLETIGTFGPRRSIYGSGSAVSALSQGVENNLDISHPLTGSAASTTAYAQLFPYPEEGYYDRRASDVSRFTLSAYTSPSIQGPQNPTSLSSQASARQIFQDSESSPSVNVTPRLAQSSMDASLSNTSTSISTLLFANTSNSVFPSETSDLSTINVPRPPYAWGKHPGDSGSASCSPSLPLLQTKRLESHQYQNTGAALTATRIPPNLHELSPTQPTPCTGGKPRVRTKSTSTTDSAGSEPSSQSHKSVSDNSTHSATILLSNNSISNGSYIVSSIPSIISWIEHTVIELWIDQEGFRLVRPTFKLSSYATVLSEDPPTDFVGVLTRSIVQFSPIKKEPYVFHHASLDPPPTLRKLTMADDDTRDYVSRQASLAIRTNGIYSVSGVETFDTGPHGLHPPAPDPSPTSSTAPLRLTWRFEYHVGDDDRRPEARGSTGRQAEKLLTPLSFACSPGLLYPSHGKKIRIIQVVRKNLTPKLTSAKLSSEASRDEPHLARAAPPPTSTPAFPVAPVPERWQLSTRLGEETRATKPFHVAHKRAQSTTASPSDAGGDDAHSRATSEGIRGDSTHPPRPEAPTQSATAILAGGATRAARWSSAKFALHGPAEEDIDHRVSSTEWPPPAVLDRAAGQLPRHILPPSQIATMLDADGGGSNVDAQPARLGLGVPDMARSLPPPLPPPPPPL